MVIRCERCSTMYELDESLLASTGSQVQCTKCQHVFVAFPPGAAGRTLVGVPVQAAPGDAPERRDPPPAAPPETAPPPVAVAAPPARPDPAARPARTGGPPPVYRPAVSAPPPGRAAVLRRDSVGAFEARLRSAARWRWLGPVLAVALVAIAAAAWLLLSRRSDPGAHRAHAEALALIALDDRASLERATTRLTDAARRAPGLLGTISADRALSLVLRAASLADEAEALAAQAGERERQPGAGPGLPPEEKPSVLQGDARARQEQAAVLYRNAYEAIRAAQADAGDTPEVARALALEHAMRGEREKALAVIRAARKRGVRDAWLDLAEASIDADDPERPSRERASVKLASLAEAHSDLLRARYLLARTQASLGHRAEAAATLDALLAANPKHELARHLRDELASHAVAAAPPPPVQAPPVKAPAPRRKILPQPAEGSGVRHADGTPVPPPPGEAAGTAAAGATIQPPPMAPAPPAPLAPASNPRTQPVAPAQGGASVVAPPPAAPPRKEAGPAAAVEDAPSGGGG